MNILLTCHRDPLYHTGGSEEVVKQFALGLSKNHNVTVATAMDGNLLQKEQIGSIQIERFDIRRVMGKSIPNRDYQKLLQNQKWDAVIFYGQDVWVTNHLYGVLGKISAKTIYFPVGFLNLKRKYARPIHTRMLDWIYYHTIQKYLINNIDMVVALTDWEMEDIKQLGKPRNLIKIPNGVDYEKYQSKPVIDIFEKYHIPRESKVVLNIGGDYDNKRLWLTTRALYLMNSSMALRNPVFLILCGKGTEKYNDRANIKGLGYVSDEEIVAFLQQSDALLVSSDFEGFGLVLLEALACGMPFISTDVGAASELAKLGGGSITEPVVEEIVKTVNRELSVKRDRGKLKSIAKNYDWKKVIGQLEKIL